MPPRRRSGRIGSGSKRIGRGERASVPRRRSRVGRGVKKALNPYVDEAEALSEAFVREVKARFGVELGFDLDDVRRLDALSRMASAELDDELILKGGFYFGEVLRRAYRGRYQWYTPKDALSLEIGELKTFPIEKFRVVVEEARRGPLAPERTFEGYLMVLAKRMADRQREGR